VLELVPDEPQLVPGLEVVARRRLAVAALRVGKEVGADVVDGRPGGGDAGREIQAAG